MNRHLLTPTEVAQMLRLHLATVYRMVRRGKIAHSRLPGGGLRFERSAVEAVLVPATGQRPRHRAGLRVRAAREKRTQEILAAAGMID